MKNVFILVALLATVLFSSCEQFGSKHSQSDTTSTDTLIIKSDTVTLSDTTVATDTVATTSLVLDTLLKTVKVPA